MQFEVIFGVGLCGSEPNKSLCSLLRSSEEKFIPLLFFSSAAFTSGELIEKWKMFLCAHKLCPACRYFIRAALFSSLFVIKSTASLEPLWLYTDFECAHITSCCFSCTGRSAEVSCWLGIKGAPVTVLTCYHQAFSTSSCSTLQPACRAVPCCRGFISLTAKFKHATTHLFKRCT